MNLTLTPKQVLSFAVVIAAAALGSILFPTAQAGFFGVGAVGLVALFLGAGSAGPSMSLDGLVDAARKAVEGERVSAPAGTTGTLAAVYDDLGRLASQRRKELAEAETRSKEIAEAEAALD